MKEKFGTLRFYHRGVDEYSIAVENAAEALSMMVCEVCGAPAKRQQNDGWISTLCEEHSHDYCIDDESPLDLTRVVHLGLGAFWSRMALMLIELCEWNTQENNMPEAILDIKKNDSKLIVFINGGDESTKGMVDLFVAYANKVDEHSGLLRQQNEEIVQK